MYEANFKVTFVLKSGQILGKENTSKLDKLPLILRWWAKINPKFRRKYVTFEGFDAKIN